jgi:hypothetical protein
MTYRIELAATAKADIRSQAQWLRNYGRVRSLPSAGRHGPEGNPGWRVDGVPGSRPSFARPGQHDHRVRLLRQRPAIEAAADLIPREAGGA